MAQKELEVGISEDGKDFTIVVDDDSLDGIKSEEEEEEEGGGEEKEAPLFNKEELLKDIPEEHKQAMLNVITNVESVVSSKLAGMEALKTKADLAESVLEKLAAARSNVQPAQTPADASHKDKPKLEDSFQFEEKDYYAPFFKKLLGVIENLETKVDGVQSNITQSAQDTLKSNVRTFFASNKVDRPVIAKMDEIAQEYGKDEKGNFVMYHNLPRLLKLAKIDLGLPTGEQKPKAKPKVNPKRQVESGSLRKSVKNVAEKPAQTMMDAFNQTLEQLNE